MASWGYKEHDGPSHWCNHFPVAKTGIRQSPVDIVPTCCSPDDALCDLKYQYTPAKIKMINTGATWRMDFSPDGSNLSGGPLDDDYKVPQEEETGGGGESLADARPLG